MYRSHYNLTTKPFQLSTDPKFLWLGEKHKEALATLKYGVMDQKGFLLVTGDVGTGKTTLINALLKNIPQNTLVANIADPALELIQFFNFVALSFNIPQKFDCKIDFIVYFSQFLKKAYSEKRNVLLIIDEVHSLSKEILEHIRLLSNIELPEEKLLSIFLVGQNEIHQKLALPECRALRQRISLVYQIESLSKIETMAYIKHRLKVAGTEKTIFTQNAIQEIYHFSKGYPRLINTLCDHALLSGFIKDLKQIPPTVIIECAKHLATIGQTLKNSHVTSQDQCYPERRSHWVALPLKTVTQNVVSIENTENRVVIPSQAASCQKQINSEKKTQNNTGMVSKISIVVRSQKIKYSWMLVLSFARHIQKRLFYGVAVAVPFLKRLQNQMLSWVFAASLPAIRPKSWNLWTSSVFLALIVLIITVFYHKVVTSKSNPPKFTTYTQNAMISYPDKSESYLTLGNERINRAKTIPDPPTQALSLPKAEISKTTVLDQAQTALQNDNFIQAIELFEKILSENSTHATSINRFYSKALQGQADSILEKAPAAAQILLSKAVDGDPQNAQAHFDLGRLYTKSKDYPKAIIAYQNAANLSYRPSDAFYNLGFIYASTKDFTNAEKMFLHAVKLKPTYLDKVFFNLAVIQQKQGKKQQCIENLEKALINNPGNQRAQQYLDLLKNN